MNKTIIWILFVVVLVGGLAYLSRDKNIERPTGTIEQSLILDFTEKMRTGALKRVGQPIEGYSAFIFQESFPGLTAEDFEGVETSEGIYKAIDGKIEFQRVQNDVITSAEEAIGEKGMKRLLENVSGRLRIEVLGIKSIDEIITRLEKESSTQKIETKINQGNSALGVKITPLEVLEDSRCAVDVLCAWAGTVRLSALFTNTIGETEREFKLNEPVTTESETLTLFEVLPPPHSNQKISESQYTFIFEISKR